MNANFTYNAEVLKIYDGDTITCNVDLGFRIEAVMTFRLKGIDTPELIGVNRQKGLDAKAFLESKLKGSGQTATPLVIKTYKDEKEKFGRFLADLYINDININQLMIAEGYAVAYNGGKK